MLVLWPTPPGDRPLPPDEWVVLENVDSVREGRSYSQDCGSGHASVPSNDTRMAPRTDSVLPMWTLLWPRRLFGLMALVSILHTLSVHKLDAGPGRLMTIAHAFNYRMAVLRDGVKSAVRVGRSRKAEGRFLSGSDISWVAVLFQIVSTVALELPSFLAELENLRGISPNVHLECEPWGYIDHEDIDCGCQSSDRTAAYVHDLTVNERGPVPSPDAGVASSCYTRPRTNGHLCLEPSWERGCPGLVLFVSDRTGAYGRLLLTVYVRWWTGLLVSSDWLRPVMRGGWRDPVFRIVGAVRLTSAN